MSDRPEDTDEDADGAPVEDDPTLDAEGDSSLDDIAGESDGDDDPFAELEDVEVEEDPFGELGGEPPEDGSFEEVEVEEADESSVWEALGEQEDGATDVAVGGELPDIDTRADEQIVPKRSYCEKCEHFSSPPETACNNPGTEIRELVDMKHFRVSNCPVVARRRGLDYSELPDEESADD